MKESDLTPQPREPVEAEPEPVPEAVMELVEADQTSLIPYLKNEIIEINPTTAQIITIAIPIPMLMVT